MKTNSSLCLFALCLFISQTTLCQNKSSKKQDADYHIMFYNVENFFDTYNDTTKNDNDFTPDGVKRWTPSRLYSKNKKIGKVIASAGGWNMPALVGLCEVENDSIGYMLTHFSPIKDSNYSYIHQESQDRRGIDVMLLYRKDLYIPISTHFYPVEYAKNKAFKSRDILYSKGLLNKDTLHIFVNHWPSKYGGALATIPLRKAAATTLKKRTDSIMSRNIDAKIIIMGDLNDAAQEPSITEGLKAVKPKAFLQDTDLINLSWPLIAEGKGTYKYRGKWEIIDHMIISKSLLKKKGLHTNINGMKIIENDFLLEKDERYLGKQPYRTYKGMKYNGGYSDHLPIMLQLWK